MKTVQIADATLCRKDRRFRFKEKLEIARQLDNLQVDYIELPALSENKADMILVRTIASFLKNSRLSVAVGHDPRDIELALEALNSAKNSRVRVALPVSPVGMEYDCHMKPEKILETIGKRVETAVKAGFSAEFCALDATRAESEFLQKAFAAAVEAGAELLTCCDGTGASLPDAFARQLSDAASGFSTPIAVCCDNTNGLALAQALLAVSQKAVMIKTAVDGNTVDLEQLATVVHNCGNDYGIKTNLCYTDQHRTIHQIRWIVERSSDDKAVTGISAELASVYLDQTSTPAAVAEAVKNLGYDLSDEDMKQVYEEFLRTVAKKKIGAKELDAIIASTALQVPPTYVLESYMVNSGNTLPSSAQIALNKDSEALQGISMGAGPIDAAFLAIEQIVGHRYELDDFQIQSVTEGKEAMGSVLVKLRSNGILYSGHGISTDIVEASIRAYINALNKIVYERTENE